MKTFIFILISFTISISYSYDDFIMMPNSEKMFYEEETKMSNWINNPERKFSESDCHQKLLDHHVGSENARVMFNKGAVISGIGYVVDKVERVASIQVRYSMGSSQLSYRFIGICDLTDDEDFALE